MVHCRVGPGGGLQLLGEDDAVLAPHIHDAVADGVKVDVHLSPLLQAQHAQREGLQCLLPAGHSLVQANLIALTT